MTRYFDLERRGTTVTRELRGAVATFLPKAYILVANPSILGAAGVPFAPAVAGTAAAAALCSILMGLGANFPIALAPGMGLNAIVAFQVSPAVGSWQTAMGLVILYGLIVLALVLVGLREAVMKAIPHDRRLSIGVGIGLFIALIGAVNAKLVIVPPGTIAALAATPGAVLPPATYGTVRTPETAIALVGLLVTFFLMATRVTGAIVIGIVVSTALALIVGATGLPAGAWLALPRFDTFGQADVRGALALAIFAAPVAGIVPAAATAPTLIAVGFLMFPQITRIDFRRLDTAIPAFILLVTIPFTYSISHGIGYGFITQVAIKLLSGRFRELHPLMIGSAALFAGYFAWA